jgi:hypothetical protein
MAMRTKQEPQAPAPGPVSPELLALWARVLEAPFRYRLTDLETRTTWAITMRDGRLVPEVEVVCGPPVMLPVRAESEDGIIGDGAIPIWPNDPRYAREKAFLDRREEILKPGRAARRTGRKRGR